MTAPAYTTPSQGHRVENFNVREQGQVQIGDRYYYGNNTIDPLPSPPSPFRNKYFEVPRNASSAFTGREEVCEQLRARCLPSSKLDLRGQQKRYVIYGLGGSGKTQVCLKFVEEHREEFWGVFWVDASSAESLERGYLQVANICGLDSRVAAVRRWLSNISNPWVLILDNADDPRLDLSPYFPVGNRGVILITSRNPECRVHSTLGSYELGAMDIDEAVTLLLKTVAVHDLSSRSMRETAGPVVLTLGCLALAITQAGAVIRQGRCQMEEYCTLYTRRRKELLSQKAIQGGEDYRYTVYTTWEVSRQMIEKMPGEVGQDALELLQIFSFLHHEGISEEIFFRAWLALRSKMRSDWMLSHLPEIVLRLSDQEWDADTLRVAVSVLVSFSLIYRDKDNLISMHPLVHTWVRDRLDPSNEEIYWIKTTSIVALSIPRTFQTVDYRFRRALVPHIDICLGFRKKGIFYLEDIGEDCQSMASRFALVYREVGRLQEALQLLERVVEIRKRTLGGEHLTTLSSIHQLTIIYTEMGRFQEALQLAERVVEVSKRTLGEEHYDTLSSIHHLSVTYGEVGRFQEALQLTERVVEVSKRTLGEEHPDTLSSIHNLSAMYGEVGRFQEALQLTERVVEVVKRTLGEEHPDALSPICNLAIRYREAGRLQEAVQLTERAVEISKKIRGEEHPSTLRSINYLAISYGEGGRLQEAQRLIERVVEARKRILGKEHPQTVEALRNLKNLHKKTMET
ncbi:MAG: hypothetical protein Q9167_000241 [Letrouitia subvulpina]